jgi:hypothetical protein
MDAVATALHKYAAHRRTRNPRGWRWRLVLWLTGGFIEAVPILPVRAIGPTETLVVVLGEPDALNTVEVLE